MNAIISVNDKSTAKYIPEELKNGWFVDIENIRISKKPAPQKAPVAAPPKPPKQTPKPIISNAADITLDQIYKKIGVPKIKEKGLTELQRDKVIEDAHKIFARDYYGITIKLKVKVRDVSKVLFKDSYELQTQDTASRHYADITFPPSMAETLLKIKKGQVGTIVGTLTKLDPNPIDRAIMTFKLDNGHILK